MTVSTSRLAFDDCFDLMDRTLEEPQGIRVRFPSFGAANYFRMRMHQARSLDREDNKLAYDKGERLYGRSIYDPIKATVEEQGKAWWLILKKYSIEGLHIESLGPVEDQSDEPDENFADSEPEMAETIETQEPIRMRRI